MKALVIWLSAFAFASAVACKKNNLANPKSTLPSSTLVPTAQPTPRVFSELFKEHLPLVLMYHDIRDVEAEKAAGKPVDKIKSGDVTAKAFEQQMLALKEAGWNTITVMDVFMHKSGKKLTGKNVLITFDDGYEGNYLYAYPILKRLNMRAAFFVHTNYIGVPTERNHMTLEQLKEIVLDPKNNGLFEIHSHTLTHPALPTLSDEKLDAELRDSALFIEKEFKRNAMLAYPFGGHDRRVVEHAQQFYPMAFIVNQAIEEVSAIHQIARLDVGQNSEKLETFMCRIEKWISTNPKDADPASCK